MFEICMIVGWALLFVLLLYIRADIRSMTRILKENKRDMLRSSFGGRTSQQYPGFNEEACWKAEQKERGEEEKAEPRRAPINASEEQVLREVLTEFLG